MTDRQTNRSTNWQTNVSLSMILLSIHFWSGATVATSTDYGVLLHVLYWTARIHRRTQLYDFNHTLCTGVPPVLLHPGTGERASRWLVLHHVRDARGHILSKCTHAFMALRFFHVNYVNYLLCFNYVFDSLTPTLNLLAFWSVTTAVSALHFSNYFIISNEKKNIKHWTIQTIHM